MLENIYQLCLIVILFISPVVFVALTFFKAPYGKFLRKGFGHGISSHLAWMIMELPAFLLILSILFIEDFSISLVTIVFVIIWEVHYIQRTFIYPFLIKNRQKKFPILLIFFGMLFNGLNAFTNSYFLIKYASSYELGWLYSLPFIIGLGLFLIGYAINLHSDHILRNLRKSGETHYIIPRQGLFNYVSSPHYFGEVTEWLGWVIMTMSPAGLVFFIFTVANLLPRARDNHKFYKQEFADYPIERKVLIPFIW